MAPGPKRAAQEMMADLEEASGSKKKRKQPTVVEWLVNHTTEIGLLQEMAGNNGVALYSGEEFGETLVDLLGGG